MVSISIANLTKVYPNGVKAIDGLDLAIPDGSFFALLGPSGCGKTTLLRTIAGLEAATGGTIRIGDRDVTRTPPGERGVAMVFQDYALFPHMTVADNIAYPLKIQKVGRQERTERATETAKPLGLDHLLDRKPGQLSGGQQQRVALARAMASRPQVFLFDEPLSNLDARLRLEARTFLKRLQHELGVTTVFVTHDQAEALAMADVIAVMEAGHIRQLGTPYDVFHRPANIFVANFIGSTPMNLVPGVVEGGNVRVAGASVPLAELGGVAAGPGPVTVGFRPEYVQLGGSGPLAITGQVEIVENLGATYLVSVRTGGSPSSDPLVGADAAPLVQAVVPEGSEPEVGAHVTVSPQVAKVLLYGEDGVLLQPVRTAA